MIGRKLPVLPAFAALLAASPAVAGDDFYGANVEAMGRAAIANPDDVSGISVNPGNIALAERYNVGGHFGIGPSGDLQWSVAAVDSKTAPIGFGIAWVRRVADPPITLKDMPGWIEPGQEISNRRRTHELTMAVAVPLAERAVSFGLNGTFLWRNNDRGGKSFTGNMDGGIAWAIDERWTVAAAGRNLLPIAKQDDLPAGVTAGVHFREEYIAAWAFDIDWQIDGDPELPVSFRLGGESLVGAFRGRLGYRFEGEDARHWIVPGVGGENKSGSVDYALAIPVYRRLSWNDLVHTFSVRVLL